MTRPTICWSCLLPFGLKRSDGDTVDACEETLFTRCTKCVADMEDEEQASADVMALPFCACGRPSGSCDRSRRGCTSVRL